MMKISKNTIEDIADFSEDIIDEDIEETQDSEDQPVSKQLICPYCHKHFIAPLFRAENPIDSTDIEKLKQESELLDSKVLRGEISEEDAAFRATEINELLELALIYEATPDEKLKDFWSIDTHENTNITLREFRDFYAEVAKGKDGGTLISDVKTCILREEMIENVEYYNGCPIKATDTRGFTTDKRICPHCHSVLPSAYGTCEVFFIAVVGIKGSGKTVMLSKFLKNAPSLLIKSGVSCIESDSMKIFTEEKKVKPGEKAPDGTSKESYKPPIFMNLKRKNKRYTCIFYDIAGENCETAALIEEKGFFVKNADGIIMLVSPQQIEEIEPHPEDIDKENNDISITDVFASIAEANAHTDFDNIDRKCRTNLAVTLSKSDVYEHASKNGEEIFKKENKKEKEKPNILKNIRYNKNKKGFMLEQHRDLSGDINAILLDTEVADIIKEHYSSVEYFAVSTLGARADKNEKGEAFIPKGESRRLEEPFVWLLYKLGVIRAVHEESGFDRICGFCRGIIPWK